MINGIGFGDKVYYSIELKKEIDKRGMKPAIKVKETFRMEVKDEIKKSSNRIEE